MFVWLPTGFSKSICYQALPFVMEHKTGHTWWLCCASGGAVLVVVPLVSLLINQVESKLFGLEVLMGVLLCGICKRPTHRAGSRKF